MRELFTDALTMKTGNSPSSVTLQTPESRMPRLSATDRERVIGRLQAGEDPQTIAEAFNVHFTTIYRLRDRFQATGTTADLPRSGRPRVTTPRQDRQIYRQHVRDRFLSAEETARNTVGLHQRTISGDTVLRRLAARDLHCRRPARRPVLTARHREARVQFAQEHLDWNDRRWRSVLFTDESRYCISNLDGRMRVWRRQGERYADNCVLERDRWGGPSVMLWGAIGINVRLGPVFFDHVGAGRGHGVNAERFINQVLRPVVVPFFDNHPNSILQQDNARPHAARATQQFLQQHDINIMAWPSMSPDLNQIEHFWDMLQRELNLVRPRPATAVQLRLAIQLAWANIPVQSVNHLVRSMPRRCQAVLNANGGHTQY